MKLVLRQIRRRAAPLGVALFFALSARAGKVETYQDIIEKAYTLSLQKDRIQAIHLLVSAAKKESKKGVAPKELLTALEEVSTVFYSDKAQQLHELALSLRTTDPGVAAQKLAEAARLEPENQQIVLTQIRQQISAGDCDGALRQVKKLIERNPFSEEPKLALGQATLCAGLLNEYQQARGTADVKKGGLEVFWQTLEVENDFKAGAFARGRDLAQQMLKSDPGFPETHYWLWKMGQGLKVPNEREGQKYLAVCKSLSSRALRQYLAEPQLCRRTAEIETELKKSSGSGTE